MYQTTQEDFISEPIPENERVGRMLKGLRIRANLTQKELAQKLNVPQSHISQYEANTRTIPKENVQKLANLLNTVESHFLEI